MRQIPLPDPGTPDVRSPGRYLWWVARGQVPTIVGGVTFGIIWMVAQSVMPAIIGRAIDEGVRAEDLSRLGVWAAVLLGVGVVQAVAGIFRHRFAVQNWLTAAYRTVQVVARHSVRLGATLPRKVSTGEVVSIGSSDLAHVGNSIEVMGRAAGAFVAFLVVAAILLEASVTLGLVVLIGVPALLLLLGPLLKPLQRRNLAQREMMGDLNTLASDIVGGLRVLRGIGGEEVFHQRYVEESQRVRAAGVQVGKLQSLLDALQIFLPGVFVVIVVWLGARFAVAGQITPGELVAFYGYSAFLMIPLRTGTEVANKLIRGLVAGRRICHVLSIQPEAQDVETPRSASPFGELVDVKSGLRVQPGRLTAVVSERPDETAELADRLGRFCDDPALLDGVSLSDLDRDFVRKTIVVSDSGATLFSGCLRDELDIRGTGSDAHLLGALATASADDVLEALPDGLDSDVEERGRSLSGGQRQRIVLARALAAEPEILVLVEPTSAVDAHTEARIASRLRKHRAGRTTVVTTASPLMLDQADEVVLIQAGRVTAVGSHKDLLADPRYRRVVVRGEDE
ncbi:MAG: ABC transporter ATP-binding protein [Propionibacteriales bacterium]|jgi:ABC-type multidrug transport system fused ATPase/permease subunit|nr:ABC transporter ATP-binding protein [Propionibacteriales bacterium]